MTPEERAVIDAVLTWRESKFITSSSDVDDVILADTIDALLAARDRAAAPDPLIWHPRTWRDVRPGDTVRPPASDTHAVVYTVAPRRFHIDPRSSKYDSVPLEHETIGVRFEPDGPMREMNPDAAVEIQLAQSEIDIAEHFGWENRVATR